MKAPLGRWLRLGGKVAAVAGVVLLVLAVRVVTSSRAELAEGDRMRAAGQREAAVVHYRRAARWYAPQNPYSDEALSKLGSIGREAEESGDVELALSAWRAVRAAIMSTRSFYVPNGDRLEAANARIASLMASLPRPPIDAGKSEEELRAEHLALLSADTRPSVAWTVVLLLGFATWIAGTFAFVTRAIDDEDRLVPAPARRWATVVVLGFGLFVLGMSLA